MKSKDRRRSIKSSLWGTGLLGLMLAHPSLAQPAKTGPEVEQAIARAMDLSLAFEKVASDASAAVVNVTAVKQVLGPADDEMDLMMRRFFGQRGLGGPGGGGGQPQLANSAGSGVIISRDGYILTNNHVIEGASLVTVKLGENAKYTAKVVGTDPATDVAVLKIEGESFPFVALGDSDKVRVGEWVIAVGNPFGLDQTVTAGIISAKGRTQRGGGLQDVQFQDFLQTDASINPGNSGGPLMNLRGEVVGINSAILSRAGGSIGIGFAIPSNLARSVLTSLRETGEVRRSWLGVYMQNLTPDLAKSFDYSGTQGVLVSDVSPASPALGAGLKAGDIITRFDGRIVTDAGTLQNFIGVTPAGKVVDVEIQREGKKVVRPVTIAQREPVQPPAREVETVTSLKADGGLGFEGQTLVQDTTDRAREQQLRGVRIDKVERGAAAELVDLTPGDVITSLNNLAVRNAADFREAMKRIDLARGVRIGVFSNGMQQYKFIRVGR